jgi:hypothetical protein
MLACIGVGRLEEAESQLVAMGEAGFPPDVRAYNILLTGYSRSVPPEEPSPSASSQTIRIRKIPLSLALLEASILLENLCVSYVSSFCDRVESWHLNEVLSPYVGEGFMSTMFGCGLPKPSLNVNCENLNLHLAQSGGAHDCHTKGRRFRPPKLHCFAIVGFRVPGEGITSGEESQEGYTSVC